MKHLIKKHEEKVKYVIVGGWNTVFGYLAFALLFLLLRNVIHYNYILVLSYIPSVTNAYIGYKFFVFKTKGNYIREYLRFYIVYGLVLAINLALLPLCVEILKITPLFSQALIVFITVIISYTGHKRYSFAD